MNKFDQFIKHKLKSKYYIRYADDFVSPLKDKRQLENLIPIIETYLKKELKLEMHPDKVFIKTLSSGVDFLGYIILPYYKVLRTKTKRRMLKKMRNKKRELENRIIFKESFEQSRESYLGMLKHCDGYEIE